MVIHRKSSTCLVVEVTRATESGRLVYTAIVSIPGREGTFERAWEPKPGGLDSHALSDLSAWVALTVQNAVVTSYGVQGVLGAG